MQSVTADAVVMYDNEVLLIKRNTEPFKGRYALPGGHLDPEDFNTYQTAVRELKEETGIDVSVKGAVKRHGQIGSFSQIDRDPRGRYVTVAYYFFMNEKPELNIDPEEVQSAEWVNLSELKREDFAFDHYDITCSGFLRALFEKDRMEKKNEK
jgi:8-oxo-dGTP diphosphatase